ncbi:hypothetical protein QP393_08975, partial [Lactobacillus gasseri]
HASKSAENLATPILLCRFPANILKDLRNVRCVYSIHVISTSRLGLSNQLSQRFTTLSPLPIPVLQ